MPDFFLPELGENVSAGDVTRVLVGVGDTIAADQPVIEIETDKATVEVPSSVAGVVTTISVKPGVKVKVGDVVLTVSDTPANVVPMTRAPRGPAAPIQERPAIGAAAALSAESAPQAPRPMVASDAPRERGVAAPASPSVRRLAREIGVDVDEVYGTGPEARITQDDIKAHARRILASIGSSRGTTAEARPLPNFEKWGEVERKAMSSVRRTTAAHLAFAWNTIPHVTQFEKADITAIEALRKRHAAEVEAQGGKLTMTAILLRVLAAAVKQFPQFNASIDTGTEEIVYKRYVNIGVAVDTDRGLLVPVVRDVDRKTLTQIAVEIQSLAAKARDRKLTLEEMSGGGISLSNLGGIGGTSFTPIVNWPEVAILGVSRGMTEPVFKSGSVQPCLMLPLSLSYDHRVIDGADAMRFLRWVADALEQPFLLSLQG